MEKFLQNKPVETFPTPEGIVFVKVNSQTGKPSASGNISEVFLEDANPDAALKENADDINEEKEDLFR